MPQGQQRISRVEAVGKRKRTVVAFKAYEEIDGVFTNGNLVKWYGGNAEYAFVDNGWYGLKRSVIGLGLEED